MFSAYSTSDQVSKSEDKIFLQNSSFLSLPSTSHQHALEEISSLSESSSETEDNSKALKIYHKKPSPPLSEKLYYEDKEPRKEYLKLDTLPLRCVPFYKSSRKKLIPYYSSHKRMKFRRYYNKKSSKKNAFMTDDDVKEQLRLHLSKNPNDIEKWIEFIQYKVMHYICNIFTK
jgi:hypothetical protein